MAVKNSLHLPEVLDDLVAKASPDLLKELVSRFVNALMSAEADAICGAPWGEVSPERVNRRNGYRARPWDTRAGTVEVKIPKLRAGSYFPEQLLERRRRAETALVSVVATCYLLGVSTRRLERLAEALGITSLSKSQVYRDGQGTGRGGGAVPQPPPRAWPVPLRPSRRLGRKGARRRAQPRGARARS